MKGTHILAIITLILWGLLFLLGLSGIDGVRAQNVPGYPNPSQIGYYIHFPAIVFGIVLISWGAAIYRRKLKPIAVVAICGALLVLPCYMLLYTGGV